MQSETRDILLVADDPAFAAFAEPLLRDHGCAITLVATAAHALHVVDQLRFDLVITSLIASEMDVIDFLQALAERIAGTPVIAIEGHGRAVKRVPAALGGGGVVLSSPVQADDLINTVTILMAGLDAALGDSTGHKITYH
jgi:DNA-binding NtrC family response regulator